MKRIFNAVLAVVFLLFTGVLLPGCSLITGQKTQYVTPSGQVVETDKDIAFLMAQRDADIEAEKNFNEAMKGASDFQAFGLTVNKLSRGKQQLQRLPTWSEDAREWARIILPMFYGGWFNQKNNNTASSVVYSIHGDNNNMSGIGNTAIGGSGGGGNGERGGGSGGSVTQDLTVNASPYYYHDSRSYTQAKTTGSNIESTVPSS